MVQAGRELGARNKNRELIAMGLTEEFQKKHIGRENVARQLFKNPRGFQKIPNIYKLSINLIILM